MTTRLTPSTPATSGPSSSRVEAGKAAGRWVRLTDVYPHTFKTEEHAMSKGMERKKEDKKKPAKSLKEKRAEKAAKRAARG